MVIDRARDIQIVAGLMFAAGKHVMSATTCSYTIPGTRLPLSYKLTSHHLTSPRALSYYPFLRAPTLPSIFSWAFTLALSASFYRLRRRLRLGLRSSGPETC
ncbi:hypothetical protein B0T22DRAFT_19476 [Podospora appendiculata]|uniref:Uncharacterized protein n=1 Tax=Podospora appendiculata TaxID=314037 RepID=A0AAE0XFT6_9PEZI|nr:hypothetical protein B0T22DRAFT_19476 [Podospora appendiculata]